MKTKLFFLLALVFQTCFAQVSNANLVAYYSFNNTLSNGMSGGNAYDLSLFGTGTNPAYLSSGGITGGSINNSGCYEFNTTITFENSEFFNLINANPNQSLSVSYWAYNNIAQSSSSLRTHFEFGGSMFARGGLAWGISTQNGGFNTTSAANVSHTTGVWNHIALVFDASVKQLRMYVNGNAASVVSTTNNNIFTYNNKFVIGGGTDANGNNSLTKAFAGRIDEMYVFHRALLPHEIISLSNKEVPTTNSCPTGNYTANSQALVDLLAGCTTINGNLTISGSGVNNLASLSNLTTINGNLMISGTPNLTNLNGLSNLTSINGALVIINTGLTNLNGISNLSTVSGISINQSNALTSISGLSNVSGSLSGDVIFYQNNNLTNLDGLQNITQARSLNISENANLQNITSLSGLTTLTHNISNTLQLIQNNNLTTLNGLQNLTTFTNNGGIRLNNNLNLTNIQALANINNLAYLEILDNSNLSNCAISSVCGLLNSNFNNAFISGNSTNCSSKTVVQNICNTPTCPTGNVTLLTQAEVDAFVAQYPNCTQINGSLTISSININNLSGLSGLTSVTGDLNIGALLITTNVSGLQNITSVGGNLNLVSNTQGAIINNINFLSGLTTIGGLNINYTTLSNITGLSNVTTITSGGLQITNCGLLASLNGLQNITSINGNISITNNSLLTDLTGLLGLTTLNNNSSGSLGNIFINQNNSLTSLNGLQNLTSLTKNNLPNTKTGFAIYNCNNLMDISALGNINNAVVEYIVISNNSNLSSCAINTVCNKLAVNSSWVTITGNATGCESIAVVQAACPSLCPPGDVTLINQADVDAFVAQYPNCTQISGNLNIGPISGGSSNITNLSGLSSLTQVSGELAIRYNQNLTNLSGLNNITSIGTILRLEFNQALLNLDGLSGLTNIGQSIYIGLNFVLQNLNGLAGITQLPNGYLYINNNPQLTSLQGLHNITTIGESMWISASNGLTNLNGLSGLTTFNNNSSEFIYIMNNQNLASLSGLQNVTSFGNRSISIQNNAALTDISAINSIVSGTISSLGISNHPNLSVCNVSWVCNYISNPSVTANIINNATGCETRAVVETACNPCPSGNVTLTTQAEVDAFVAQYPNCTQINGNLVLNGQTINNISAFSNINTINGLLQIQNSSLTNLNGLQNLNSVQRISITSNPLLTSIAQLIGISGALTGNLSITQNSNLSSLNGLQNITECVRLTISNNDALTDLTGLNGLTTLISPFNTAISVDNNDGLISLNGIQNLVNFTNGGGFFISDNPLLNDISAINSNVDFAVLTITNNSVLSNCAIEKVCNFIQINSVNANISNNAINCTSVAEVLTACNPCPTGNVTLTTQAEVDAFVAQYPNCTEINGLLTINGGNINNLSSLSNITSITNGLNVFQCNTLASLNGLQNVTSINGNISIANNPLLVDLTGLNGLTSLNNNSSGSLGNLFLNQNNNLISLNGLENLTTLTKDNLMNTKTGFAIYNCNNLTDISALGNINNATVEFIVISNNTNLSNCAIATVCNKLAVDTNWVTISGNATGCQSVAIVSNACQALGSDDFTTKNYVQVYPNPFNDQLQLQFHQPLDGVLSLFDITGIVYLTQKVNGNHHTINNLGHLAKGIYVIQVQTNRGETFMQKLVK
ncbi:MAG: LamG-like jellyroll fold domain-containing protein [Flavobacterium sp.]